MSEEPKKEQRDPVPLADVAPPTSASQAAPAVHAETSTPPAQTETTPPSAQTETSTPSTQTAPSTVLLPATVPVRASPPLWQWLAIGLGGTVVVTLGARSASSFEDAKPVVPSHTAEAPPTLKPAEMMRALPQMNPSAGLIPAPLLTVNAGPLAGGTPLATPASTASTTLQKDAGKGAAAATTAKKGKDSFPTESAALDAARTSLDRKEAVKATAILDQYDKDYPSGLQTPAAVALRIEALALREQDAQALSLAGKFLQDFPHSPQAPGVRSMVDQLRARAK